MKKKIFITQIRSSIGLLPKHKSVLIGLGLRGIRHTVRVNNTLVTRGMINKINYLIKVS
ncbi:MAG: 50S ribosomal protein L30 [gamma proteobacterium endosymbiont of Trioza apicalis]